MQSRRLKRCLPWLSATLFAANCAAQVMQQPGTMPGQPQHHPAQHRETPRVDVHAGAISSSAAGAAADRPQLPASLLNKPAQPASVTLNDGVLAIHADNSSLSAILHQVASSSGMTVDGFRQDQRIFGVYGPGNPRDILSSLLQDAGYNFLMVGTTERGTPKEIVLTARSGGAPTSGPARPEEEDQPDQDDNSDSGGENNFPQAEPAIPDQGTPPGAATAPPNADGHVKTPAEIIQELQRMRQQQQNPQ